VKVELVLCLVLFLPMHLEERSMRGFDGLYVEGCLLTKRCQCARPPTVVR